MASVVGVLVVLVVWLSGVCGVQAQDKLPALRNEKTSTYENRLIAELLYQGPELERFFVEGQLSLWLPGAWTFDHNHTTSLQLGVEGGVQVMHLWRHHLYAVGGLTVSPQTLEQHLGAQFSTLFTPWIGMRYLNDWFCSQSGAGCGFVEVGLGLTFEITDEASAGHHSPMGAWTVLSGLGYRHRLGSHGHLGARLDFAYLDDRWANVLAWITPTLFGGTSF